ncbi:MAG: hypothetical protein JXR25_00410 [Pontiellaceae bacterium]|nr:hypothetical protein [Pontiellaceae bacterium]MBN2783259.1 hypothetical protein [Pontiellaceae bacterium]
MKKMIVASMAAGLVASAATAGVGVSMDFASAYVFRGITYNDGFVFQPGIEADGLGLPEELGGVAVGAWGNYDLDDYGNTLSTSELSELDLYVSYSLPTIVSNLDLSVGYCDYTYPGLAGESDKEVSVGVGYEVAGIGLGFGYYVLTDSSTQDPYADFSVGYGMDLAEDLGAEVGARVGFVNSTFSDYDISAALSYTLSDVWSIGGSLAYIGQGDEDVLPDGMYAYDVDFVGMVSLSAGF